MFWTDKENGQVLAPIERRYTCDDNIAVGDRGHEVCQTGKSYLLLLLDADGSRDYID
jgi:hypothetical protein